ncbi:unnamed protein product [Notodromas monacha]|uniref:Calpain catalytic domain-containing protein n=1 Tax=Notodromas monacha TaxID=399045 RepID=A0A7R9BZH7_9CRUS|nr:unnamed protein product [Notodromas monacha]CAG0923684.1 unnamed protein product [Notodromas monacha]
MTTSQELIAVQSVIAGDLPVIDDVMATTSSRENVESLEFDDFKLYEDPEFPATPGSVFREGTIPSNVNVEWKRPCEIVEQPYMYGDNFEQSDIMPGNLADCWFLSTCAAVAREPQLIHRIVPPNQLLYGEQYSGIVFARFWRMGQWVTVYFDDRLPVSADGKLLFARSSDKNEFWISLLEKAYAK